jgi:hypothetical protein
MLPQPAQLTLPFCWEEGLLGELQHQDIIDKAQQQQVGPAAQPPTCLRAGAARLLLVLVRNSKGADRGACPAPAGAAALVAAWPEQAH